MLELRSMMFAPPGGEWFYTASDGANFSSKRSYVDLEAQVARYLAEKGLPVPLNLRAEIQNFMCRRLPESCCTGEGSRIPGSVAPSFFELLKNLDKVRGQPFVPARVAEDRATVCRACRFNNMGGCGSCNGLEGQALAAVGNRRVLARAYLGNCTIVAIPTYALVWVEKPAAAAGLADNCWIRGL